MYTRGRERSTSHSRRVISEFEKYLREAARPRTPSPYYNPRCLPAMKPLHEMPFRAGLTDLNYFYEGSDPDQTYKIQIQKPISDWTIEEFLIRNVCPHSCLLDIRGPEIPNVLIESKYYKQEGQVKIRTSIEGEDEDTIQWKEAPNQYIGAIRELLPYLTQVKVPPQEITTQSALLSSIKLRELIETPFVTIIISDTESGKQLLREMPNYTGRTRFRVSFEYVDNQEEYDIDWSSLKPLTNYHFFKGYFPTFTKEILYRSKQRSLMVMNCNLEPDDLMHYVDLWRCNPDLEYEGCCIGFKEYQPDSKWDNFKNMFTGMSCWSDYAQWNLYNDVIQEYNWNFHIGNTYNLSRADGYVLTVVLSNRFFIMAVTNHPQNEYNCPYNSALLRLRLGNYCFYPLNTICLSKYGTYYNRYNDCTASCDKD